jgi:hypothetical protein
MAWYGGQGIPVELNEPHHWGMRDASDVTFVVSAYLAAYNARAWGVRDFIAQMMFNSPPGMSDAMDLAKMLSMLDLITPLERESFHIWRQTRTGLLSYPLNPDAARGHLAASVYLQMALHPHIVHVVGHTEARHAAEAEDVIQATSVARRAIENALGGQPDMSADPKVRLRRDELAAEARQTLAAIQASAAPGTPDPLSDPATLARAVTTGILDAPQLKNNPFARGAAVTRIDSRGACIAIDPHTGKAQSERERIASLQLQYH